MLGEIQLARYRFHCKVITPLQLPAYAGSTLRGVFGHALRQQACLMRARSCDGCTMLAACPYPQLFEPQRLTRPAGAPPLLAPYAIEAAFSSEAAAAQKWHSYRPGEKYQFDMVLMTPQAIQQLPLIIASWRQAFGRGLGRGDGQAELLRVELISAEDREEPVPAVHASNLTIPEFSAAEDVLLHLETPLRLEQQGRRIGERELTPGIFLRHLIRRVGFLLGVQRPDLFPLEQVHQLNALADKVQGGERQLQWCDWSRYSTRQKQKMTLGGLVGHWQLQEVPEQLLPFIYLGQWLHVGKECAFGLGKYRWIKASQAGADILYQRV